MRAAILVSSVVTLAAAAIVHAAMTFNPISPAARPFRIGSLAVTALHDSQIDISNDGKTFGLGVSTTAVADVLQAAGAPTDRISLSVNELLVRDGPRILLIDTGLGQRDHGQLLSSLAAAGVSPGAITDVLITHPHIDHIGGLLDAGGRLAFPNATIRMAAAAWTWMQKQVPPEATKVIATRIQTFAPGAIIAPGIRSISLPGHTPGHVGYEIASRGSRLLDVGDIAHSSIVSLAKPQWEMAFDSDRAVGRKTRLKMLATLANDHELVFSPHFPFPGVGHIERAGEAFAWQPGVP